MAHRQARIAAAGGDDIESAAGAWQCFTAWDGCTMIEIKTLTWDDVEPVARVAFKVWVGQPELRWAKRTWQKLTTAGLATYSNELGYTQAALRFIALACIYNDFWQVSWLEELSMTYVGEWWRMFNLSPFRIGQLVGPEFEQDNDTSDIDDDEELVDLAIDGLIDKARSEVTTALVKAYNGPAWLIVSLHHSTESPLSRSPFSSDWSALDVEDEDNESADWQFVSEEGDDDGLDDEEEFTEADAELLVDVDFVSEYLRAYEWILAGCPEVNGYL